VVEVNEKPQREKDYGRELDSIGLGSNYATTLDYGRRLADYFVPLG